MTSQVIMFAAVVLVAGAGLAGCSRDPQRYGDLAALAQAVSEAGVDCERVRPRPEAQLVIESGTCAGSGVTLYLFDSAGDLDAWKKVGPRVNPAVIGPNWAATGTAGDLASISDELSGELVDANE